MSEDIMKYHHCTNARLVQKSSHQIKQNMGWWRYYIGRSASPTRRTIGSWSTQGAELPSKPNMDNVKEVASTQIYFHDIPGAQQSVLRMGHFVGERTDEKAPHLLLANQSVGGMFTARINMNLREDKGGRMGQDHISHTITCPVSLWHIQVLLHHIQLTQFERSLQKYAMPKIQSQFVKRNSITEEVIF